MTSKNYMPQSKEQGRRQKPWGWLITRLFARSTGLGTDGVKSGTPTSEGSSSSNIVQRIKDLRLTDFIECYVKKDLTVLGDGTAEQLQAAWMILLSQFYEAKEDENIKTEIDLESKMKLLKYRAIYVDCCFCALEARYNEDMAAEIAKVFPSRPFTKESYMADMRYIRNTEKMKELDMMHLKTAYDVRQKAKAGRIAKPPTENGFYESLVAYNQIFTTKFSVNDLNTLEYALMMKAHARYDHALKEKNRANGR